MRDDVCSTEWCTITNLLISITSKRPRWPKKKYQLLPIVIIVTFSCEGERACLWPLCEIIPAYEWCLTMATMRTSWIFHKSICSIDTQLARNKTCIYLNGQNLSRNVQLFFNMPSDGISCNVVCVDFFWFSLRHYERHDRLNWLFVLPATHAHPHRMCSAQEKNRFLFIDLLNALWVSDNALCLCVCQTIEATRFSRIIVDCKRWQSLCSNAIDNDIKQHQLYIHFDINNNSHTSDPQIRAIPARGDINCYARAIKIVLSAI